jgi:hypothetical protein
VTRRSVGPFTSASGMCFLHGAGDVSPHRVPSFPKYVGDFITANHLGKERKKKRGGGGDVYFCLIWN